MLLVYSQCPLWWTGESRYVILPHTKRKRKLTKVAASITYSSFESEFPEETGRMVQWLTARVRTIKNDRELFKKRNLPKNWGFLSLNQVEFFFFFCIFGGSYGYLSCLILCSPTPKFGQGNRLTVPWQRSYTTHVWAFEEGRCQQIVPFSLNYRVFLLHWGS